MLTATRWLTRIGRGLVEMRLERRGEAEATAFADLWWFYRRFNFVFKFRKYYSNPFCVPMPALALRTILRVVRTKYPNSGPSIELINGALLEEMVDTGQRTIIVTIHNGVSSAIVELLERHGRPCSLVSVASAQHFMTFLGGEGAITIIAPGPDLLLRARRDMRDGRAICCHPDSVTTKPLNVFNRFSIGTGIFEFARVINARIFYVLAQVSDAGAIVVRLDEPRRAPGDCSAAEMAQDFAFFLNSALVSKRNWAIA